MRAGVAIADPLRIDIRGNVTAGRDVRLDINVVLEGHVRFGDRVVIGPGAVIRNATIGSDTVIHPYSVIDGAEIRSGCVIGPYARLRPGSQLAEGAHVGNFVELKNAVLGARQ
jgi:bifunctional UDP-N-acetylglucosamine pyrophosphorylase/glucosamine-1-phosphate N-acetyltransferase